MHDFTLISDVDGILSTGEHGYSKKGKVLKLFGSNEKDALKILKTYFKKIIFCSADKVGEEINKNFLKNISNVEYIYCSVEDRQNLINKNLPCVYIGDGINEPKATVNICLLDSTPQAKQQADVILQTVAGKNVFPYLLEWVQDENIVKFAYNIKRSLKGKIIFSGVGKNYSLAQLVSEFFLPYNFVAIALDANHSTHGSLGIIDKNDTLIVSSKSGDTKEVVDMMSALSKKIPNFKNTFLITSNLNCILKQYFEHIFAVQNLKEDSLYKLNPQSTIEQYLKIYFRILNILNINNCCTKEQYLLNHQGGTIGKLGS